MASPWRVLPVSTTLPDLPLLLVRFESNLKGYTILVTDLVHLWSESLSAEGIAKRAVNESCSIDPLESPDQFAILLAKVGGALLGGSDTALSLQHAGGGQLVLRTTSPLPPPLPPLRWPVYLSLAPAGQFSRELVLPLIGLQIDQAHRTDVLLRCVREKDHVIGKLVDKVESSGVQVGDVFLSAHGYAANRKGLSWDQAGRFVKGLRPFDEGEWKKLAAVDDGSKQARTDVILKALSGSPVVQNPALNLLQGADTDSNWWSNLDNLPASGDIAPATGVRGRHSVSSGGVPESPEDEDYGEDDDDDLDDFQTQDTPPPKTGAGRMVQHAASKPSPRPSRPPESPDGQQADDETTDDEFSNLGPPKIGTVDKPTEPGSQHGLPARSLQNPVGSKQEVGEVPSPRKLGTIGGRRDTTQSRSVEERRPPLAPGHIPVDLNAKPSVRRNAPSDDGPVQQNHPGAPSTPRRLGKIGGAKRGSALEETPFPDQQKQIPGVSLRSSPRADTGHPLESADRPVGNLPQPASGPDLKAAEAERGEHHGPPHTVSQETADRRREELKRQIAQKPKAPEKKPRKF